MDEQRPPPTVIKKRRIVESVSGQKLKVVNKEQVIADLQMKVEDFLRMMVEDSEDIKISINQGERTTVFAISCGQHNIAKIIGRKGRTIDAIRTLVMSIAGRYGFRAIVEVPYFPESKISE